MKNITIEDALKAVADMRTPIDMNALWCVVVIGPGTIIAQPNRLLAEARAKLWQSTIDQRYMQSPPTEHDPVMYCSVQLWPGSEETHAHQLTIHGGDPEDIC